MLHIKAFQFNDFCENTYLLWGEGGEAVIVDPGMKTAGEEERFHGAVASLGLRPQKILLTHGHFDHIYGVRTCMERYGIPCLMNGLDRAVVEDNRISFSKNSIPCDYADFESTDISDGDLVTFGGITLEAVATPGHTPGGMSYLCRSEKVLFSGDTLFAGSIGRTDFFGGDYDVLMRSIFGRLMTLDGDIDVLPGHGPCTDIASEGMKNPFLQPFNEPLPDDFD